MQNSITFTNGHKMPIIGFGTFQRTDVEQVESALEAALEVGYRHIDTAYLYENEAVIGRVLKKWLDSGKLTREELFIVTKLPPTGLTPEKVSHFLNLSLRNLQLNYLDLYLIHLPCGLKYQDDDTLFPIKDGEALMDMNTDLEAVWKAMELEVDAGRVRSLGVSNFNVEQIERIGKTARYKPMNHQVELNAYFQQKPLREACEKLGVTICAYAPVGSPGRKEVYKAKGLPFKYNGLVDDLVVKKIAESKGKTTAQVLLRFLAQQEIVVIPKSSNPQRIVENFQIFDFELSSADLDELRNLDKGEEGRTFTLQAFEGIQKHPEYPFKNAIKEK